MEVVGVCAVDEFVGGVHGDGEKVGTEQELRGVGQESETGVHCVGLRAFYRALATSSLQNSPSLPCTRNIYSLTTSRLPLLVIPLSFPYSYYPNSSEQLRSAIQLHGFICSLRRVLTQRDTGS